MSELNQASNKHRVRIIFDGVVAIGPPPPEEAGREEAGPLFGVMAKSTRQLSDRSRRNPSEPPKYIPAHVPTIYTRLKATADSRPPDETFQRTDDEPEWQLWHPIRERMEFRFDGVGTPGKLTYDDPKRMNIDGGSLPAGTLSTRSIRDVPDARRIWPERATLREGLMAETAAVRPEAAAQILVPWGNVCGGGLFEKGGGVTVEFDPPRGRREARTVVPNVIVSVDAAEVEIAMYSLDTGDQLDSLRFRITEDTDIWVSNGDPSDTALDRKRVSEEIVKPQREQLRMQFIEKFVGDFGERVPPAFVADDLRKFAAHVYTGSNPIFPPSVAAFANGRASDVDIDFELFYSLLEGEDDDRGLPVPRRPGGTNFSGPDCFNVLVNCPDPLRMKSK